MGGNTYILFEISILFFNRSNASYKHVRYYIMLKVGAIKYFSKYRRSSIIILLLIMIINNVLF